MSERALYNVLGLLQKHELVTERVYATAPRHVTYQLTSDGHQALQFALALTRHVRSARQAKEGVATAGRWAYSALVSNNSRISIKPADISGLSAQRLPPIDTTKAHPARIYDYGLGGKNNFEADRIAAEKIFEANPDAADIAKENRRFLRRAVQYLITECGVRQFIDIGSGIPTQGNTHEIAQSLSPDARVAYVDNDPIAITHGRALLESASNVSVTHADLREPDTVLQHSNIRNTIDFTQPVALLLVAVLHFISDDDHPHELVARYRDALADGSHLVLSHVERNPITAPGRAVYATASAPASWRSREEIESFFQGFTIVEPGLVYIPQWRPEGDEYPTRTILGGVGTRG